jgi:hypothetical protein
LTVADISSIEADVSSRLAACSSVRCERSVVLAAISADALVTSRAEARIFTTTPIICVEQAVHARAQSADLAGFSIKRDPIRQIVVLGGFDDRLHLLYRLLKSLAGLDAGGDVGRVFHDLERFAVGIQDRIITCLNPNLGSALAYTLVFRSVILAASELFPK